MTPLPWTVLGLPEGFSCETIELRLAADGYLDHLEHGKVDKPSTINERSLRPERGGLFDARIFGALADGFANAAEYRAAVEAELAAQPANDEPTPAHPRRDRFGRVELCEPLVHPALLLRGSSWLAQQVGMKPLVIREVLTHERYVVFDSLLGDRAPSSTITADELSAMSEEQRAELRHEAGGKAIRELLRRRGHELDPLISRIYILPAQFRPMIPIDRRRWDSADLNDLYRRVINRNYRLTRLAELNAPQIILRNERAELLNAVDHLFDNSACKQPCTGPNKRRLESLWDFAGGPALAERLRRIDDWVASRGYPALERGLPWALFRTWRGLQALGFELGEP